MLTPVSAKKIDHLRRIWFAPHELLHEPFGLVVPQIVQHSVYVQADASENFLDLVDSVHFFLGTLVRQHSRKIGQVKPLASVR